MLRVVDVDRGWAVGVVLEDGAAAVGTGYEGRGRGGEDVLGGGGCGGSIGVERDEDENGSEEGLYLSA